MIKILIHLLSIDELGVDEEQFSALDSDGDGLVTQDEIASAIDSKLASLMEKCLQKKNLQVYFLI